MALITLYRGLRNKSEKERLVEYKTAGGKAVASTNPNAPTEDDMKDYEVTKGTGGECAPPAPNTIITPDFVEYTFCENVAMRFAIRTRDDRPFYMAIVEVDEQYVTAFKNDPLEHGVLIKGDTPLNSVKIVNVKRS